MIEFVITLITSISGQIIQEDMLSKYQLVTTTEICEEYIKPAFEQKRKAGHYVLEVRAECVIMVPPTPSFKVP